MNCEQAHGLISARLDREITPEEARLLDEHLAGCPACQAVAEAFALQDTELRQAFEPRRQAAAQVARAVAGRIEPPGATTPAPRRWMLLALAEAAIMAASIAGVLIYIYFFASSRPPVRPDGTPQSPELAATGTLTPRPLPETRPAEKLAVGEQKKTGPAERTRLGLPDGSVLYVDRDTTATLVAERTVRVEHGNVYVEVAPNAAERFVVHTPTREVTAHGTRFQVQVADKGTGVVVTQGRVAVSDLDEVLVAGRQLLPGADQAEPAPRASHLLDWTRDLMDLGSEPLVPRSRYDGGSLIAYDSNGQEAKLSLRDYRIDVHIEDGFARTTIDQTYFNHHPWRLEGTFHFPLPANASLSQLTMYVNGERQEGGMVERNAGRAIYQKIVNGMRDPALLEWVDGTTFKMRVFPLEGRQEKRILLSYTQRLPSLYGRVDYRFPAGHTLKGVRHWQFTARLKDGAGTTVVCPTHPALAGKREGNDLLLSAEAKNVAVDRDVVLHLFRDRELARGEAVEFRHADYEGHRYLMARFRPELTGTATRQRRDWVFLYEASADRDPLVARVQIEVFRHLLQQAEHDDTFSVLVANSRVHLFGPPSPATAANIDRAVAWLEKAHLVGALDLGSAFTQAGVLLNGLENPHLVHLGSGHPGIGAGHDALKGMLPPKAKYVGVGVGKRWARSFMKGLAEATGGLTTQINPDEQVAWRSFELLATLNTPRLLNVTATFAGGHVPAVLVDQAMLAQGEELCAFTRVPLVEGKAALPGQLIVRGMVDGQPFEKVILVDAGRGGAGYLPRTWARLEIDRLLAADARGNREAIIALSKASYVMTPFTSLLVLENDAMRKEFNQEAGRKDHWAAFEAPDKIPVVYEPDPTQIGDVANAPRDRKPSKAEVLNTILVRVPASFLRGDNEGNRGQHVTTALEIYRGAFMEPVVIDDTRRLGRLSEVEEDREKLYFDAPSNRPDAPVEYFGEFAGRSKRTAATQWYEAGGFGTNGVRPLLLLGDGRAVNDFDFSVDGSVLAAGLTPARLWSAAAEPRRLSGLEAARVASNGTFFGRGLTSLGATPHFARLDDNFASNEFGFSLGLQVPALSDPMPLFAPPLLAKSRSESRLSLEDFKREAGVPLMLGDLAGWRPAHGNPAALRYERLAATGDRRLRDDLLGFAPGLNTSAADVQALLEAEAEPELRNVPGRVDPKAAELIEAARRGGWQRLVPAEKDAPAVLFDASGRFIVERQTALGLQEQVLCDGATLLSLYPELGLAGRRTPSRFHRAELAAGLPFVVVPAADLARGADLEAVAERTVAVVPHHVGDKKHYQLRLVFAADGKLAERQMVAMPKGNLVLRQVLLADGVRVVRIDAEGKETELARTKWTLTPAAAPDLARDLAPYVVLDLPFRNRETLFSRVRLHAGNGLDADVNGCYRYLERQDAVQVLAQLCVLRNGEAGRVLEHCFLDHGDLRPGLLVLMAAGGVEVGKQGWFGRFLAAHPGSAVVRYFGVLHDPLYSDLRPFWPINLTRGIDKPGSFLARLARFHELFDRWQDRGEGLRWQATRGRHLADALAFLGEHPKSLLARTLLVRVQANGRLPDGGWRALADAWGKLDAPGDHYRARYERAACLRNAGDGLAARDEFLAVAGWALKNNALPLLDDRFYHGVRSPGPDDPWTAWVEQTSDRLIAENKRLAVLDLATRCRDLGDRGLAENLVVRVVKSLGDLKEEPARLLVRAAVVERLLDWGQPDAAEVHLGELLAAKKATELAWVSRLAARVAAARGRIALQMVYLEAALDLEARDLPEVIDLNAWRDDYRPLLNYYLERARVLAELGPQADSRARQDLVQRTVRAIDRLRSHDPEAGDSCRQAGLTLRLLGAEDLAWDYLTTPHAGRDEPASLHGEAVELARAGAIDLAERTFQAACAAEPHDAALWWDRAQALRQAGRIEPARSILRDLAAGKFDTKDQVDKVFRERAAWLLQATR